MPNYNSSYIWHSIFATWVVIKKALGGESVMVKILIFGSNLGYSSLSCCMDILNQILSTDDIREIQKLLILNVDEEDAKIQKLAANGAYTIKNTYKKIMESLHYDSDHKVEGPWEQMWKMNAPPKIKHHVW